MTRQNTRRNDNSDHDIHNDNNIRDPSEIYVQVIYIIYIDYMYICMYVYARMQGNKYAHTDLAHTMYISNPSNANK